ncbi:MAG TPA: hypothetical protein VKF63_08710 [Terracidiphilus sp.]|nr:hypothetical protein [Terracidiphilus sp.]
MIFARWSDLGWDIFKFLLSFALTFHGLTGIKRCDTLVGMEIGKALHPTQVNGSKRLILSLAGAVLISTVGFGLILLLAAWLIPRWMMWQSTHHQSAIISVVFSMFVVLSSAMIRAARKRRSARI